MVRITDASHAGKTGRAGTPTHWHALLKPIGTRRPIAPAELARAMVVDLAARFSLRLRLVTDDGKAVRS